jgi:hypothetical protein
MLLKLYSKRNVGQWRPILEPITSLIVDSKVQLLTLLQRERGGVRKVFPIGWAPLISVCKFFCVNRKRDSTVQERGREGVVADFTVYSEADFLSKNRHFMKHGQFHA